MSKSKVIPASQSFINSRGETFRVGDWILHDFAIKQLKEVRKTDWGFSVTISDGYFSIGTSLDEIYTLTLFRKIIADGVDRHYEKLKALEGEQHLNWPDINRKCIGFAYTGYELCTKWGGKNDDAHQTQAREEFEREVWDPLEAFCREIGDTLKEVGGKTVGGVKILRT